MDIDRAIRLFSDFLNKSWEIVIPLLSERCYASDESSKSDWLQTNWEMLVERKVLQVDEYLEIYGEGADFNAGSSRITDIKAIPSHFVKVFINSAQDFLNNQEVENCTYTFEKLVGFKNGFYIDGPLFNFVLVNDEEIGLERVFSLEKVKFELGCVPLYK